jgi:hypothetical protein
VCIEIALSKLATDFGNTAQTQARLLAQGLTQLMQCKLISLETWDEERWFEESKQLYQCLFKAPAFNHYAAIVASLEGA